MRFFDSIGIKAGNKKRNDQEIPNWIFEDRRFMKACLRGLIDADGSVYLCANWSRFPRINFCSNIDSLKEDFRKLAFLLGYTPTPPNRKNTMIYRKKDIFKY